LELVLLVALVNAFSLGGIVMAGIFFVIFILKELEFKLKLVVFTMLLFLLVAFSQTENGQRRIQELKASPSLHEVVKSEISTNSFTWRMVNWKVLLEQWQKSPVLGYGLNTAEIVNPWHGVSPHNDYLRFLVECGIVGFLMTGGFFIVTWKRLARIIATETNPKKHYLAFLMQTVFVSWMVGAAVDNYITTTTFQFYFWALLAAVMVNPQDGSELTPKESPLPLDPCDSGS
jgi:O-antigen ligase